MLFVKLSFRQIWFLQIAFFAKLSRDFILNNINFFKSKGHVIAYSPDFKHQDCLYKHNSPVSEVKVSSMVQSIISTSQQSDFISFHQVYNRSTARVDCKAKVSGIHFGAKGDSIYVNYENIGSTIYNLKMAEIQTLKTIEKPTQIRFSYDGDSCIIADEENYCYVYGHWKFYFLNICKHSRDEICF